MYGYCSHAVKIKLRSTAKLWGNSNIYAVVLKWCLNEVIIQCFIVLLVTLVAGPAPRGDFRGRVLPRITACAPPQATSASPSEDRAPKVSNMLSATGVQFGACATPKYCLWPPAWVKICSTMKNTSERQDWVYDFATKTFFGLHHWICGQEARSAPSDSAAPRLAMNVSLQARLVSWKKINGQNENLFFFWSSPLNLWVKFVCAPQIFFLPPHPHPPKLRYFGAGPGL